MVMKLKIFLIAFFIFCFFSNVFSQVNNEYGTTEPPNIGVVVGYSGLKPNMIELGVGYQPWEVEGGFVWYPFAGFLALAEFSPDTKLFGTSLNAWYLSGPFACGLGINRYVISDDETYGIKPMIGISFRRIGIMYGYNFYSKNNTITDLHHDSFTIKYYLPLWRKK